MLKELVRIVDVYDDLAKDTVKAALLNHSVIDSYSAGLPMMEDVIEQYKSGKLTAPSSVLCLARVGDLWSDPTYNRILELRYSNQKQHIERRGGFSHVSADVLSAFVRPNIWKAVTTKGNNRTSMLYGVTNDPNARIVISCKLHPKDISHEEMIRIESLDHTIDAVYRTNQSGDHKFKSAYYAKESWAVELYKFVEPFSIDIAGTNEDADFSCPSHSYLSLARKLAGDEYVKKYLRVFTELKCDTVIFGNAVVAGSLFLKTFAKHITEVDTQNNRDSFKDCMKFWFKQRETIYKEVDPSKKCLTQQELTEGNAVYKGNEPAVSRFVSIYNEYCNREKLFDRLTFNGTYSTAIPLGGDVFENFLDMASVVVRSGLRDMANNPVIR